MIEPTEPGHPAVASHSARRVQFVNCYVTAAADVMAHETGMPVERAPVELQQNPYTTCGVTAVIGISGSLAGNFYLSMSESTALAVVEAMLGQPSPEFDDLAQSGISELANVIAGTAGIALAQIGVRTVITPPMLVIGSGARLSWVETQRLVVPLTTSCGGIEVHVALRETE
jgi:chemotaxis protein CheX